MINLLNANLNRIRKNKSFFLLLLFCTLFAFYTHLMSPLSKELSDYLFQFWLISGIVIAIFTISFIGLDYSDGTIRNKITIGHKRINIYLANLITSVICAFIFYGVYVLVIIPLANQHGAKIAISSKLFIKYFGSIVIGFISYSCVFTFISMNVSNRVIATIINILLSVLLVFIPFKCSEIVSIYHAQFYTIDEIDSNTIVSSYNRPSKEAMLVAKTVINLTPIGRAEQLVDQADYYTKPPILFLYSLGTNIFITTMGILIFNRKRLN